MRNLISVRSVSSKPSSLRALVLKGSIWTIAGHGGGLIIRMARSLIMTRLLFPEAYGVMSLVWAMLYGLQMFSDVGLAAAIIRDKRGDDPRFLNTALRLSGCGGVLL